MDSARLPALGLVTETLFGGLRPREIRRCDELRCALAACLLLVSSTWAFVASAEPSGVVLAVGSNHGLDDEIPLRFAVRDAERTVRVMTELGGMDSESVFKLIEPSKAEFLGEIQRIAGSLSPDALLLIHYSGHGSSNALHLRGEKLPLDELRWAIRQTPVQHPLLVIDACRGKAAKGSKYGKAPSFVVDRNRSEGIVEVLSTGPGELAIESNELEAGLFSYYFANGLRGPADLNDDQRITLDEVYEYASDFSHQSGQEPWVSGPVGSTRVLTDLGEARTILVVPLGEPTYYTIIPKRSESDAVRVRSSSTKPTFIGLSGDQFIVRRAASEGVIAGVADIVVPLGGVHYFDPTEFTPIARSKGRGTGGFPTEVDHWTAPDRTTPLSLSPHSVTTVSGFSVDEKGGYGPALAVEYAMGVGRWSPTLRGLAARRRLATDENWASHDELRAAFGFRSKHHSASFTTNWGAALAASFLRQELVSRRASPAGRLTKAASGWGGGVEVHAGAGLPLKSWLDAEVVATGSLLGYESAPGAVLNLEVTGTLALGLSIGL